MTKNELRQELVKRNIPTDLYYLDGGLPNEAHCLNQIVNGWEVYYSERGQKTGLKIFKTEDEACDYFYQSLLQVLGDMGILQQYSKTDRGSEMSSGKSLTWIECDGGPHLVLEKRLIGKWQGPNCPLHYDRACEIEDYVGVMPVEDGYGIVIFDDVLRSAWIPGTDGQGGYLVVWNYCAADIDDQVINGKITAIPDELFNPTNLTVSFCDDTVYLFPACDYGPDWVYGYCEITIKPGTYTMDTVERYDFEDCSFRVHRLRKI